MNFHLKDCLEANAISCENELMQNAALTLTDIFHSRLMHRN